MDHSCSCAGQGKHQGCRCEMLPRVAGHPSSCGALHTRAAQRCTRPVHQCWCSRGWCHLASPHPAVCGRCGGSERVLAAVPVAAAVAKYRTRTQQSAVRCFATFSGKRAVCGGRRLRWHQRRSLFRWPTQQPGHSAHQGLSGHQASCQRRGQCRAARSHAQGGLQSEWSTCCISPAGGNSHTDDPSSRWRPCRAGCCQRNTRCWLTAQL
jgi:hypothetical protein